MTSPLLAQLDTGSFTLAPERRVGVVVGDRWTCWPREISTRKVLEKRRMDSYLLKNVRNFEWETNAGMVGWLEWLEWLE